MNISRRPHVPSSLDIVSRDASIAAAQAGFDAATGTISLSWLTPPAAFMAGSGLASGPVAQVVRAHA